MRKRAQKKNDPFTLTRRRSLAGLFAIALMAVTLLFSVPLSGGADAEATTGLAADTDCSDGYPRVGCKIWKVTVGLEIGIPTKGSVKCETTDKWQCIRNSF